VVPEYNTIMAKAPKNQKGWVAQRNTSQSSGARGPRMQLRKGPQSRTLHLVGRRSAAQSF
jgi:hypothetical protein